jgi:hypothetical protein
VKSSIFIAAGLTAASLFGVAASSSSPQDKAQTKFMTDVSEHGVSMTNLVGTLKDGKEFNMGQLLCDHLRNGSTPFSEITGIADTGNLGLNLRQAMVITYWAIRDICPEQVSKGVKAFWADEVKNPVPDAEPGDIPPPDITSFPTTSDNS